MSVDLKVENRNFVARFLVSVDLLTDDLKQLGFNVHCVMLHDLLHLLQVKCFNLLDVLLHGSDDVLSEESLSCLMNHEDAGSFSNWIDYVHLVFNIHLIIVL